MLTIPNMVVVHGRVLISFMLIQKTKYYVINQEFQLLFFRSREVSGGESLLGKPVSPTEISRNPSKYLPCCYLYYSSSLCTPFSNIL